MTTLTESKPADFDAYWASTLEDLGRFPAAPEVDEVPLRSTEYATAYVVHMTSTGPYRIFAHLSIPKGTGPFPTRYYLPRYGSVVEQIPQGFTNAQRREYLTYSVGVRGQRGADQPFAAAFPGLLTHHISDHEGYIFRDIVADCVRGLEYLMTRPEVDRSKVVAMGGDTALATAALGSGLTHLVCTPAMFFATADLAPRTEAYPLQEINDYLRQNPSKRDAVARTLSYFDLRWFAPRVKVPTVVMTEGDGDLLSSDGLAPLTSALGGQPEVQKTEYSGFKDNVYIEEWVTRQFGLSGTVLPAHWQGWCFLRQPGC